MSIVKSVAGVLCTRVRLEEKRLIAALGSLDVAVKPFPPSDDPLPIQPLAVDAVSGELTGDAVPVLVDRLQERDLAAVWLPYWRTPGRQVIDAGAAATQDRLAVARLMTDAGLSRPETALVTSEQSGLAAIARFGGCGTLLPLRNGASELPLHDLETAEAVLEHRHVLGDAPASIALVQRGVACSGNRIDLVVVDGVACGWSGSTGDEWLLKECCALAEQTAGLLGASLVGISIADIDGRLVIWDVNPVPDFRNAKPVAETTVERVLAELVARLIDGLPVAAAVDLASMLREESGDHVVLSA